jgi:hypothetical protein
VSLMCELFGCRCSCSWLLICFCVLWALLFCSVSVAAAQFLYSASERAIQAGCVL